MLLMMTITLNSFPTHLLLNFFQTHISGKKKQQKIVMMCLSEREKKFPDLQLRNSLLYMYVMCIESLFGAIAYREAK